MKAFSQISIPHSDILQGRLTMDVFAADIWQVITGKAPADYLDRDLFFSKTYTTKGLKNLIEVAKLRIEGKGGDSVIQLQTPFGGGKTHALIALFHQTKQWGTKACVFDGTALNPKEAKPWEELEKQLTGKINLTKGNIAPGKEKLIEILAKNQPAIILMDEILEYATKAAGIKVGDSNLAAQTLAFIQELSGAVSTLDRVLLVITLPSSLIEHYDENAEKLYSALQKITGRTEKIYTPVEEDEIEHVIRKRLFQSVNETEVKKVVDGFVNYARSEGLLPEDEVQRYREKFLKSFPFKPEVIDVLYKKWGSFPTFQRTRGVLRLLSLVIFDLMDKKVPYIRLGDFELGNNEIRRELIKHIGQEWDSIIAQDITSKEAGAKIVDDNIGQAYRAYKLGSVVARTIFMYSFSGKGERGAGIRELKLATGQPEFSGPVIDSVINGLREKLFYLADDGLYFSNRPNLNRILLNREENVTRDEIIEEERALLEKFLMKKGYFSVYVWPDSHRDVAENPELKLAILKDNKPEREFLERHGDTPRIYRNTLIFLAPDLNQKPILHDFLRRLLALRSVESDEKLGLTESQKKEIKNKIKNHEQRLYEELRKYYRNVFLPARNGFRMIDLGLSTYGETFIDKEIYNRLRSESEILEKISAAVIKEKYLRENQFVSTKNLLETFWKTPGEIRIASADALKEGVREGVERGIFGLGYLEDGKPQCKYFKQAAVPEFSDDEIILRAEICQPGEAPTFAGEPGKTGEVREGEKPQVPPIPGGKETPTYKNLHLRVDVPRGRLSDLTRIINFINSKFTNCHIEMEIKAEGGEITISDYEDKIKEALRQAGIEVKFESNQSR
ncbi:MAG: AAA family ATPase [Candidatus Aminicenantes bacterium]|nr:MAG: AAA family ATPase [Candidatus Aminicenantes bacterium]